MIMANGRNMILEATWFFITLVSLVGLGTVGCCRTDQQQQQQVRVVDDDNGAPKRICPDCGMQNPRKANHCGDCGFSFKSTGEE